MVSAYTHLRAALDEALREARDDLSTIRRGFGRDVIASRPTHHDLELAREIGRKEGIIEGLQRAALIIQEQRARIA